MINRAKETATYNPFTILNVTNYVSLPIKINILNAIFIVILLLHYGYVQDSSKSYLHHKDSNKWVLCIYNTTYEICKKISSNQEVIRLMQETKLSLSKITYKYAAILTAYLKITTNSTTQVSSSLALCSRFNGIICIFVIIHRQNTKL